MFIPARGAEGRTKRLKTLGVNNRLLEIRFICDFEIILEKAWIFENPSEIDLDLERGNLSRKSFD